MQEVGGPEGMRGGGLRLQASAAPRLLVLAFGGRVLLSPLHVLHVKDGAQLQVKPVLRNAAERPLPCQAPKSAGRRAIYRPSPHSLRFHHSRCCEPKPPS